MVEQTAWPVATDLRDHWQWRPDWATERPCLMWYLTFESQPELTALTERAHTCLADVATVDLVPVQWLHLTLDEVGFVDTVPPDDVEAVVASVREAVGGWRVGPITLGPVRTMADAVVLQATSAAGLDQLCDRLRAGTTAVLDRQAAHDPEPFWAHVSLAYVNQTAESHAVMEPLAPVASANVRVTVPRLTLAAVTRRNRHYQWTERAHVPLEP